MTRRLLNLLALLSLLLCVAASVLWARSDRGDGDRLSWRFPRRPVRYTLVSRQGRLTLMTPPAAPPPAPPAPLPAVSKEDAEWIEATNQGNPLERAGLASLPPGATAAGVVSRIRNEQVIWEIERPANRFPDLKLGPHHSPRGGPGTATQVLAPNVPVQGIVVPPAARHRPFPADALVPPLLSALEDPDRWVAAHVLLSRLSPRWVDVAFKAGPDDATFLYTYNGLRAELRARGGRRFFSYSPSYGDNFDVQACAASIDPAQHARIRDWWHRRLDVPAWSAPHWQAAAAAALLPAAWCGLTAARLLRGHGRKRRQLCPACGYDLRATPEQCPECGTAAVRM